MSYATWHCSVIAAPLIRMRLTVFWACYKLYIRLELEDFLGAKFYSMCALADSRFLRSGLVFTFVVLDLISTALARRLARKDVSEMTCFVSSGT